MCVCVSRVCVCVTVCVCDARAGYSALQGMHAMVLSEYCLYQWLLVCQGVLFLLLPGWYFSTLAILETEALLQGSRGLLLPGRAPGLRELLGTISLRGVGAFCRTYGVSKLLAPGSWTPTSNILTRMNIQTLTTYANMHLLVFIWRCLHDSSNISMLFANFFSRSNSTQTRGGHSNLLIVPARSPTA